jgi:hypothetical protein
MLFPTHPNKHILNNEREIRQDKKAFKIDGHC